MDPEAIEYCNSTVRPLAEQLRALIYKNRNAMVEWYGGLNTKIPNTSEVLEDGRAEHGVSVMTGIDVNNFMALLATLNTTIGVVGNDQTIEKPCVRPLEVTL